MKQIVILFLICVIAPIIVTLFFLNNNGEEQKPLKIESDISVKVKREATGNIEKISLEDYVIGVVAGEMPVSFHIEALKAQAVAARSYVLKRIEYNKDVEYDVVDSVTNQVYLDDDHLKAAWKEKYNIKILKIYNAVLATKGEYIEYDNKIADALFFSTSNGFTENSEEIFGFEVPYLRSVESVWDKDVSPVFNDDKTYTLNEFYNLLNLPYQEKLAIKETKTSSTGRILELEINGQKKLGSDLVGVLKIRSNDFEISQEGQEVIIKTTGYGHGVGMSQYGALGMAQDGYLYDEILKYYYKGITIGKL